MITCRVRGDSLRGGWQQTQIPAIQRFGMRWGCSATAAHALHRCLRYCRNCYFQVCPSLHNIASKKNNGFSVPVFRPPFHCARPSTRIATCVLTRILTCHARAARGIYRTRRLPPGLHAVTRHLCHNTLTQADKYGRRQDFEALDLRQVCSKKHNLGQFCQALNVRSCRAEI